MNKASQISLGGVQVFAESKLYGEAQTQPYSAFGNREIRLD